MRSKAIAFLLSVLVVIVSAGCASHGHKIHSAIIPRSRLEHARNVALARLAERNLYTYPEREWTVIAAMHNGNHITTEGGCGRSHGCSFQGKSWIAYNVGEPWTPFLATTAAWEALRHYGHIKGDIDADDWGIE